MIPIYDYSEALMDAVRERKYHRVTVRPSPNERKYDKIACAACGPSLSPEDIESFQKVIKNSLHRLDYRYVLIKKDNRIELFRRKRLNKDL